MTLFQAFMGQSDYNNIPLTNAVLATILFILFALIGYALMFNLLIATMNDAYSQVTKQVKIRQKAECCAVIYKLLKLYGQSSQWGSMAHRLFFAYESGLWQFIWWMNMFLHGFLILVHWSVLPTCACTPLCVILLHDWTSYIAGLNDCYNAPCTKVAWSAKQYKHGVLRYIEEGSSTDDNEVEMKVLKTKLEAIEKEQKKSEQQQKKSEQELKEIKEQQKMSEQLLQRILLKLSSGSEK